MAALKKKRTKPRPRAKAKKRARSGNTVETLDAGWRSFIMKAAGSAVVTMQWTDPTGTPSAKRALREGAKKKTTTKAAKKKPSRK